MSQAQIHDRHQSAPVGARRRRNLTSPLGPIGGARTLARMVGRAAILQAYEVGLMASLAATVPLHLAGDRFGPAVGAPVHAHTAPRLHLTVVDQQEFEPWRAEDPNRSPHRAIARAIGRHGQERSSRVGHGRSITVAGVCGRCRGTQECGHAAIVTARGTLREDQKSA